MISPADSLLELIKPLEDSTTSDKQALQRIRSFIRTTPALYRHGGSPEHHLCAFFVPIVPGKRLIYLGHHKKANDWIPPGGHMEPGEMPNDTIKREFKEELSYELIDEPVHLFDISIKDVSHPKRSCKTHYDLWYLVEMIKPHSFTFQASEFYDAAWMNYEEAVNRMQTQTFLTVMKKLRDSH